MILVDSGSSHSFLNTSVAAKLLEVLALVTLVKVQVADGTALLCSQELKDAEWSIQGYTFHSTLKVLPLGSYDMIVGIDWPEAFSPMKIHWQQKWMLIPYGSIQILLQGNLTEDASCSIIQLFHIASDSASDSATQVHSAVQNILNEFESVFSEPTGLPPQ